MATIIIGWRYGDADRDTDGFRTYIVEYRIKGAVTDGPANALRTAGLPTPGTQWSFDSDSDVYAYCRQQVRIRPVAPDDANRQWLLTFTFTNKADPRRCKDVQIDDPLLEPQEVSGSSVKFTQEWSYNYDGTLITNSAWELVRGPQVEFDANRDQVVISQNVANLQLPLCVYMRDRTNDDYLWGMAPGEIKLSDFSWERKFYGACFKYYRRKFTFDIRKGGFVRWTVDEGTKFLNGHWTDGADEFALDNIGGIATPRAPTLTATPTTGGGLGAGIYGYKVSALSSSGETLASGESVMILTADAFINLSWPAVPGAIGYRVYGRTVGGEQLMAQVVAPSYVDTGASTPAGNPPIVNTAGGIAPDRNNPQHFVRAKDRAGENMRVMLDGFGTPAGVVVTTGSGELFISVLFANTGHSLLDTTWWIPLVGPTSPQVWDAATAYVAGNLVIQGGITYLCFQANTNVQPPSNPEWLVLPDGAIDGGQYRTAETYNLGEYVRRGISAVGNIKIDVYASGNFLLLAIPTSF